MGLTEEADTAAEQPDERRLIRELRQAGLTARAIDAAWPEWWSEEARTSTSAATELRFTLARRLGLSPSALLQDRPVFLWRDEARFKSLSATEAEREVITSFGMGIARLLISAAPAPDVEPIEDPLRLRAELLQGAPAVGFDQVASAAWAFGIPVVYASILPTASKRMHAMSVQVDGRFAIVLGRQYTHRSHAAYAIAHELGHCLLGHLSTTSAIVEMDDPVEVGAVGDEEERAADRFALEVLTGSPEPQIQASDDDFNAIQLAYAALAASPEYGIDAGVLALCLGHRTGLWRQAFGALKRIPPGRQNVGRIINALAWTQLRVEELSGDGHEYLANILGVD